MLQGKVASVREGRIVLAVGGVGYIVAIRSTLDFVVGNETTLHTHLAVRENALDLYGFLTLEELRMFEELIKLPKIGPKSAMQILMQADVTTLKKAIATQDPIFLTKMSGIGKKTAEKIVAELKDAFADEIFAESTPSGDHDVIDALMTLGYSQKDAREASLKISADITDTRKRITAALKIVSS